MMEKSIKEELRAYSERYCAKELKEAGFTNYRDDLINWYKVYNGIISHFHLVSYSSRLPSMMMVWRIHPTYVPAALNVPAVWMRFQDSELWSFDATQIHLAPKSFAIFGGMNLPEQPNTATERLVNEFLPQIERLNTREELYAFRRNEKISRSTNKNIPIANIATPDFADEALMMKDSIMYHPCIEYIEGTIRLENKNSYQTGFSRSPELLKAQMNALKGIEVEKYMELMKERKQAFMKRYKLQDDFEL